MRPFLGAHDRIVADDADVHILVLGDSTGESYNEWAGLFAQWLGTQYPTHTVEWEAYWNSGAEDWGDTRTVSTGTGSHTIKLWVAAGSGWGMAEATGVGVIDHPSAVDYVVTYIGANSVTESEWDTGLAAVQSEWPDAYITIGVQHPVIFPYTPPGDWVATALNDVARGRAAAWGLGWFDAEEWFLASDAAGTFDLDDLFTDGVHPNATGSGYIADLVEAAFLEGAGMVAIAGKTPELLLQAKNYGGSGDWLDESGNGHNATITGAQFLDFDGVNALWSGSKSSSNNYLSIANHADYQITTHDLDLQCKVKLDDYTPSYTVDLISRRSSNPFEYSLRLNSAGTLELYWHNGTGFVTGLTSSASVTASNGEIAYFRCTRSISGANYEVDYYESSDGSTWTPVGVTQTVATASNTPGTSSNGPFFGGRPAGGTINGYFYWGRIYKDGTLVGDVQMGDAVDPFATFTERANGRTVTVSRDSSGYVSTLVDRHMWALSTDDYFEIADDAALDFAADEALTVLAVVRPSTVAAGQDIAVAKKDNLTTSAGWALGRTTAASQLIIADGTADDDDTAGTMTANTLYTLAGVRNVTDDDIEAFLSGTGSGTPTTDSTTATLANALPVRIGATSGTAANFWEGQIVAVALFREALTDQQIRIAGTLLANGGVVDPVEEQLHGEALKAWIVANDTRWTSTSSPEIVGLLNELNGTNGVEYAQARATYLSVDPAG